MPRHRRALARSRSSWLLWPTVDAACRDDRLDQARDITAGAAILLEQRPEGEAELAARRKRASQEGRETVEAALEMVGDVHDPERRGLPPMVRRAERAAPVTRFEAQIVAHEEALRTDV